MNFLNAGDVISGREGTAFMTIDGRNVPMFFLKNIEATVELVKTEVPVLGKRMNQQKVTGANGTGSMTIHKVTSEFAQIGINYLKSGKIPMITIKVTNEDPASTIGRQSTLLKDVIFDSVVIAKLDIESETLDEDVDFTFADADLLDMFTTPKLG
ncbi:phage tail tube protein [Enterococcus faecalis]|uniref:phage tail tube protein n=1 Tax=Enterococcus faecalis TaxID=1351 RepID=UPI000C192AA4|nr:phage tail tube protein [Enterococcus faecalis]PJO01359.1 phage portal protein [Enterococcus faecalis]RNA46213.1 phage portal protein [Enterococcus faecalis]RNA49863.1 phage portal protein [Enterococcus faecalis]RNA53925.1 phage portal protein [Enterococcus faecalis]RNA56562.1 phage portal protein [Enterococcus faecalis]